MDHRVNSASLTEFQRMLNSLRVPELKKLLEATPCHRHGRKAELVERAITFIQNNPQNKTFQNSIREWYNRKVLARTSRTANAVPSEPILYPMTPNLPNGGPAQDYIPLPRPPPAHHPARDARQNNLMAAFSGGPSRSNLPPTHPQAMATPLPSTLSTAEQQQRQQPPAAHPPVPAANSALGGRYNVQIVNGVMRYQPRNQAANRESPPADPGSDSDLPLTPDVLLVPLPFYDVLDFLLKPHTLMPSGKQRFQENVFTFTLSPQQLSDIQYDSTNFGLPRMEVQMRICEVPQNDTTAAGGGGGGPQKDAFPDQCLVKLNSRTVALPNFLPQAPNSNQSAQRLSRPVDLTQYVVRTDKRPQKMHVSWAYNESKNFCVSIIFVRHVNSEMLLERLKVKSPLPESATKAMIQTKLKDDWEDLAMTTFRLSLLCPLVKVRMTIPAKAKDCNHVQCFDAYSFLAMNEKRPTWTCAVCNRHAPYAELAIDSYLSSVLSVTDGNTPEIEIKQDGSWAPVTEEEAPDSEDEDSELVPTTSQATAKQAAEPLLVDLDESIMIVDAPSKSGSKRAKPTAPSSTAAAAETLESRSPSVEVISLSSDDDQSTSDEESDEAAPGGEEDTQIVTGVHGRLAAKRKGAPGQEPPGGPSSKQARTGQIPPSDGRAVVRETRNGKGGANGDQAVMSTNGVEEIDENEAREAALRSLLKKNAERAARKRGESSTMPQSTPQSKPTGTPDGAGAAVSWGGRSAKDEKSEANANRERTPPPKKVVVVEICDSPVTAPGPRGAKTELRQVTSEKSTRQPEKSVPDSEKSAPESQKSTSESEKTVPEPTRSEATEEPAAATLTTSAAVVVNLAENADAVSAAEKIAENLDSGAVPRPAISAAKTTVATANSTSGIQIPISCPATMISSTPLQPPVSTVTKTATGATTSHGSISVPTKAIPVPQQSGSTPSDPRVTVSIPAQSTVPSRSQEGGTVSSGPQSTGSFPRQSTVSTPEDNGQGSPQPLPSPTRDVQRIRLLPASSDRRSTSGGEESSKSSTKSQSGLEKGIEDAIRLLTSEVAVPAAANEPQSDVAARLTTSREEQIRHVYANLPAAKEKEKSQQKEKEMTAEKEKHPEEPRPASQRPRLTYEEELRRIEQAQRAPHLTSACRGRDLPAADRQMMTSGQQLQGGGQPLLPRPSSGKQDQRAPPPTSGGQQQRPQPGPPSVNQSIPPPRPTTTHAARPLVNTAVVVTSLSAGPPQQHTTTTAAVRAAVPETTTVTQTRREVVSSIPTRISGYAAVPAPIIMPPTTTITRPAVLPNRPVTVTTANIPLPTSTLPLSGGSHKITTIDSARKKIIIAPRPTPSNTTAAPATAVPHGQTHDPRPSRFSDKPEERSTTSTKTGRFSDQPPLPKSGGGGGGPPPKPPPRPPTTIHQTRSITGSSTSSIPPAYSSSDPPRSGSRPGSGSGSSNFLPPLPPEPLVGGAASERSRFSNSPLSSEGVGASSFVAVSPYSGAKGVQKDKYHWKRTNSSDKPSISDEVTTHRPSPLSRSSPLSKPGSSGARTTISSSKSTSSRPPMINSVSKGRNLSNKVLGFDADAITRLIKQPQRKRFANAEAMDEVFAASEHTLARRDDVISAYGEPAIQIANSTSFANSSTGIATGSNTISIGTPSSAHSLPPRLSSREWLELGIPADREKDATASALEMLAKRLESYGYK